MADLQDIISVRFGGDVAEALRQAAATGASRSAT